MSERDRDPPRGDGFEEEQAEFLRGRPIDVSHSNFDDGGTSFDGLVGGAHLDAAFTAEDARQRKGNYIIPFGLRGSGKTTFLASLFKYIDESPLLDSQIVIPERRKVPNYAGQAMLNEWQKIFNNAGRFLGATPEGDEYIRELTYEVQPNKGQRTKLLFNVIEVSGEDLQQVIAKEGEDPRLPAAIEAVFLNKNIRPVIVLVVHPNRTDNDLLFGNMMSWLNRNVKNRLKTFSLAVIVANPDLALRHLHDKRPDMIGQKRLDGKLAIMYLQAFAPRTFAIFNSWLKSKRAITPFYIGKLEKLDGFDKERITKFNNRNASQVFGWMYRQTTGRKLGLSFVQRLFRTFNE